MLAIVLIGGIASFIFSGSSEPKAAAEEEYQIVDITPPPPPPPPPEPDEETMEEPEEPDETIEPLDAAATPESTSDDSSDVDIGIDIGDLAATSGTGGFVMDIPRFGRRGGGGSEGEDSLLGGDLDSPPTPTNKLPPTYPSSLLSKGLGGRVLITCSIDESGQVTGTSIKQSSGHPELDKAAINAVNKWKFKPASKGGRKVKATCVVPFNFEVKKA